MTTAGLDPVQKPLSARLIRLPVDFWIKPIRGEPLALFRIVLALTMIASALTSVGPHLSQFWSADSLIPAEVGDEYLERTKRLSILRGLAGVPIVRDWFPKKTIESSAEFMHRPAVVYVTFALWMMSLAYLALGFFPRTSALFAWFLTASFSNRAVWVLNGGDDVGLQGLFYLIFAPSAAAWSIDAWRRRRRGRATTNMIRPWSVRLIQIQLCCIYLFTAISKTDPTFFAAIRHLDPTLTSNDWLTGEALYWVFNDITLTRWSYAMLPVPLWLCRLAAWGTMIFEFGFVLFVLIRPIRKWILIAGVLLHVSILASMEIGWFSQFTLCFYAVFLSGSRLCQLVARLRPACSNSAQVADA